jgi:HSP20 family protein
MSLIRFDPTRELLSLRDAVDRLMEESFVLPSMIGEIRRDGRAWGPAVDMFETDDHLVVKASMPGIKPENLEVTVKGEVLTIKGEIKEEQEKKEGQYYYHERRQGTFSRSLTLPFPIQSEKAEATFEDGVLLLRLPRAEATRPHPIKVATKHK